MKIRILNLEEREMKQKIIYLSLTNSSLLIVTNENSYRSKICIFINFKV